MSDRVRGASAPDGPGASRIEPRVLVCLGPCRGEFHLPMDYDETPVCPVDAKHTVAVYGAVTVYRYCDECGDSLSLARAGRELCKRCEKALVVGGEVAHGA